MTPVWYPAQLRGLRRAVGFGEVATRRRRRRGRARYGELVQIDGSPHDWFEGLGSRCTSLLPVCALISTTVDLLGHTPARQRLRSRFTWFDLRGHYSEFYPHLRPAARGCAISRHELRLRFWVDYQAESHHQGAAQPGGISPSLILLSGSIGEDGDADTSLAYYRPTQS
jgi:hypothetical protein